MKASSRTQQLFYVSAVSQLPSNSLSIMRLIFSVWFVAVLVAGCLLPGGTLQGCSAFKFVKTKFEEVKAKHKLKKEKKQKIDKSTEEGKRLAKLKESGLMD